MNKKLTAATLCSYGGNYGTGDHCKQRLYKLHLVRYNHSAGGAIAMVYVSTALNKMDNLSKAKKKA